MFCAISGGFPLSRHEFVCIASFDFIDDPETRFKFKNLPTTFALASDTVDMIEKEGGELLLHDQEFIKLLHDLQ
jgi:hypothetical protein